MNPIFVALSLVTVTLHVSTPIPSARWPNRYGLNTCTGVFVSPNEILTAGHCRGHQWVKTEEGESLAVTIEKKDLRRDLALLKVIKPISHAFALLGNPSKISDSVYTVNSGDAYDHTYNTGIVNNVILDDDNAILTILHNASIMPGASGSGLFNSSGELIGINVATIKSFSCAVDLYEIKSFLIRR